MLGFVPECTNQTVCTSATYLSVASPLPSRRRISSPESELDFLYWGVKSRANAIWQDWYYAPVFRADGKLKFTVCLCEHCPLASVFLSVSVCVCVCVWQCVSVSVCLDWPFAMNPRSAFVLSHSPTSPQEHDQNFTFSRIMCRSLACFANSCTCQHVDSDARTNTFCQLEY